MNLATLKRWIEIGKIGDPIECTPLHRELFLAYSDSKSELEQELVYGIRNSRDWRANTWLLERLFRDDYNPKLNDLVEAQVSTIVEKLQSLMSDQSFEEFINALSLAQTSYLPEAENDSTIESDEENITIEIIPT